MIAYYSTEIEVEVDRPLKFEGDVQEYDHRLYTVEAEVDVHEEWCELRKVTSLWIDIGGGEKVFVCELDLPAAGLRTLRLRLADDEIRRTIYKMATEIEDDEAADLDRRVANEQRLIEENDTKRNQTPTYPWMVNLDSVREAVLAILPDAAAADFASMAIEQGASEDEAGLIGEVLFEARRRSGGCI